MFVLSQREKEEYEENELEAMLSTQLLQMKIYDVATEWSAQKYKQKQKSFRLH